MGKRVGMNKHKTLEREFETLRQEHCELCGESKKPHNTCYLCHWGERFDWEAGEVTRAVHADDPMVRLCFLEERNRETEKLLAEQREKYNALIEAYNKVENELRQAKNEVCNHCGLYKMAHLGYCNGCRWGDM